MQFEKTKRFDRFIVLFFGFHFLNFPLTSDSSFNIRANHCGELGWIRPKQNISRANSFGFISLCSIKIHPMWMNYFILQRRKTWNKFRKQSASNFDAPFSMTMFRPSEIGVLIKLLISRMFCEVLWKYFHSITEWCNGSHGEGDKMFGIWNLFIYAKLE